MSEKDENIINEEMTEETQEVENQKSSDKKNQKRWYIVHTYSGYENKVKSNLEKRIEYMNMADKIFRVEVPQKTITQIKGGRKQEKEEKIFPGYVLVEMIMDEDSWYVVRHTAGVTKFVGSAKKPIPAKDSEIKKIIHRSTAQTQKIEMDVKVGEKVRIISGPFAEFVGDITEVYPDKAKLRAMVSIFGRETPVELEYKQIQKLQNLFSLQKETAEFLNDADEIQDNIIQTTWKGMPPVSTTKGEQNGKKSSRKN